MQRSTPRASWGPDERGFTLPELMMALTLTLVMGGAALSTVMHVYRTTSGANGLTDVNQNLRVALNILVRDLIQTGLEIPVGGIPFPGGTAQHVKRPGPAQGEIDVPDEWETLPSVAPGPGKGPVINGIATDIVTMLRSDMTLPWDLEPIVTVDSTGQSILFKADFPIDDEKNGIVEGDLIMITGGAGRTIMEVTSVLGQRVYFAGSAKSNLNQHNAPAGSIMQMRVGNPLTFPAGTYSARRILMVTYYLDDSGASPTLMRRINYGKERKLAVGIEDLQFTWDLVDDITNPSNQEQPIEPNTPNQIRKANIKIAGRSFERSVTGSYLRSNLSTQVALRSLAFVDRYQ